MHSLQNKPTRSRLMECPNDNVVFFDTTKSEHVLTLLAKRCELKDLLPRPLKDKKKRKKHSSL